MSSERMRDDERLDPRIRSILSRYAFPMRTGDVADREAFLAVVQSPRSLAERAATVELLAALDTDAAAPRAGLVIEDRTIPSSPDGNAINLRVIRPEAPGPWPCVYYIHGGGMLFQSCYDGNYQVWGRILAAHGVAVVMVDFRNAGLPSSVDEVAPYPAGLNDCESGLRWVVAHTDALDVDPSRIVIAGESGGGNLALATAMRLLRAGDVDLLAGVYAMCPFIAGTWPQEQFPSSVENDRLVLSLHNNQARVGYGIEAFERRDPLAWPGFATEADVRGLPPTVVRVNEADPLRDEGIAFYRLLLRAGVRARCDQIMGTVHAIEVMPAVCPDITRAAAADIAAFATHARAT